MTYNDFKNAWNGRVDDYDHVYLYQCVDVILRFMQQVAGVPSGIWGNAIDYANSPTPAFSNATIRITDGNYQPGDIIVLYGLSGNPYGHIGLYDHGDGSSVALLEQNGASGNGYGQGNDKISVWRTVSRSRIAAAYRLKVLAGGGGTPPSQDPRIGRVLYLHPVPRWSVYRRGDQPLGWNRVGYIAPANYYSGLPYPKDRGLTYNIIGVSSYPNTVTIQTGAYGIVDIYVDSDGEIL